MYRGILQPRKQIKTLQQEDTMHHCSESAAKNPFPRIAFQHGKKRLNNESSPVPLIISNNNDDNVTRCEQNKFDHTQQMANFFLDPDPAAQERDVVDDCDVCVIITNVVIETTELDKTDNDTNPD